MKKNSWPEGYRFAFSIFDDTDNASITNCKPVYDYLIEKGVITTKSVWVYPSRGTYSGSSLSDAHYLDWIRNIKNSGVEIGLHNIGDGFFGRDEILSGLDEFEKKVGYSPKVHCNHVSNADNLYWWDRRFVWPINFLYRIAFFLKHRKSLPAGGEDEQSGCFWGDAAQRKIKYVRNLTFTEVNTLRRDPKMPWHDPHKAFVNYWFSSSDGHDVTLFNNLLASENLDRLEAEGGACIAYTHFASGFVDEYGNLDPTFKSRIDDLASRNGWFVPCGQLLDYLLEQEGKGSVSYWYRLSRNLIWIFERFKKALKYRM